MSSYRFSAVVAFLSVFCTVMGAAQAPESSTRVAAAAGHTRVAPVAVSIEDSGRHDGTYVARSGAVQMHLSASRFQVDAPGSSGQVSFTLLNANERARASESRTEGESNYLIGQNSSQWRTHVPHLGRVEFADVYPGIGTAYYGSGARMEHDFIVAAGARYDTIRMRVDARHSVAITEKGDLQAQGKDSTLLLRAPIAYQVHNGRRVPLPAAFRKISSTDFGFRVQNVDPSLPLVIDPVVDYATYLSPGSSPVTGIAIDAANNTYISGIATADYPATSGSRGATCPSCTTASQYYVYVTKLNATGTAQIYSTFVGGNGGDSVYGIAVDPSGNAVVTGNARDASFPTKNALANTAFNSVGGAFAFSLAPDGAALNFSTPFVSSSLTTYLPAIATGSDGSIYLAGQTSDATFPYTQGALQSVNPSSQQTAAVLLKLTASGAIVWSGRIGNPGTANGGVGPTALHINSDNTVLVAGTAGSVNSGSTSAWPVTAGAYQSALLSNASNAPFLTKVAADGSAIVFSTLVGSGSALAMDTTTAGDILLTGAPGNTFPTTPGAFGTGSSYAYLARVKGDGSALLAATLLGSSQGGGYSPTTISTIRSDNNGNVWVGGASPTGFGMVNPIQPIETGTPGALLAEFDPALQNLLFSTYLNGSTDSGRLQSMAFDSAGKLRVGGITSGTQLPTTPGAFRTSVTPPPQYWTRSYGFVASIDTNTAAPALCLRTSVPIRARVGTTQTGNLVLSSCGAAPLTISGVGYSGASTISVTNTQACTGTLAPGASCQVPFQFAPVSTTPVTGSIAVQANTWQPTYTATIYGTGTSPSASFFYSPLTFGSVLVGATGTTLVGDLANLGTAPMLVYGAQAAVTGDFQITTNSCIASNGGAVQVLPQQSCAVTVVFNPTQTGTRSGTLTIPTDDPQNPVVTVALTGQGVSSYPVPAITQLDQYSAAVGSAGFVLQVQATNVFPASVVLLNGVAQPTTYGGTYNLSVTVPASLMTGPQEIQVSIQNPAPGGGLSNSETITLYKSVPLTAASLLYEPVTAKLYASIGAAATSGANTIAVLDPASGNQLSSIAVGNDPKSLAASADGHYLYVGANGDHTLQRIDLTSGQVDRTFALPRESSFNGLTTIGDMHVVPGSPQSVVVSLQRSASPSDGGGALFNDAGLVSYLSNGYPKYYTTPTFSFTSDPGTIYFASYGASSLGATTVTATGLVPTASTPTYGSYTVPLATDGTLLYASNGSVFDPLQRTKIASFVPSSSTILLGNAFTISATDNRAIFSGGNIPASSSSTYNNGLIAFDLVTRQQTDAIGFGPANLGLISLQRFGLDGFAGLSSSGITLFHSHIANSLPANGPFISALSPAYAPRNATGIQVVVTGTGFTSGSTVLFNGQTRATTFNSASQLKAQLTTQDLATAGSFAIQVQNTGGTPSLSGGYPFLVVGDPIVASSNTVSFAAQRTTTTSGLQTVIFSNRSGTALAGLSYVISGPNAGNFQMVNNCPATLAANAGCSVVLTFTPDVVGTRTATMSVVQNGTALTQSVALTGIGALPTFSLLTTSYQFGTVGVGLTDARAAAVLTNSGSLPLTNITVALSGLNASEFQADASFCNSYGGISAGSSCSPAVTFQPTSVGDKSATLTIGADYTAPQTVQITGHAGQLSFTIVPSTLDFGSSAPVGTLITKTAVLTNTGEVPLYNLSGRSTYTANSDLDGFQFFACPSFVPVGGSCTIKVNWIPPRAGQLPANVGLDYGLIGVLTQHITFAGTGGTSVVTYDPLFVDFGSVPQGMKVSQQVTIANPGASALNPFTLTTSGSSTAFATTNNCGSSLPAGGSCVATIQYTSTGQPNTGQSITLTAGSPSAGTRNLSIRADDGYGYTTAPYALSFGSVRMGQSAVLPLTTTSSGTPMTAVPTISGANAADFKVATNCASAMSAGQSCTFNVTFTPTASGTRTAVLTVGINLYGGQQIPLSGTALNAPLAVSLTSANFGTVTVGTTAQQTVTVTNTGATAATGVVGIVSNGDFSTTNNCPASLSAGASCALTITFAPTGTSQQQATLAVTANGFLPQNIGLTGQGSAPALTVSPTALSFGGLAVGKSVSQTLTLTNTGNAPLNTVMATLGGSNASEFAVTSACPGSLAASASCTLAAVFTPSGAGTRSAQLQVGATGLAAQSVSLTGTGLVPSFTVTPASLSFGSGTVGQPLTQTLTFTNTGQVGVGGLTYIVAGTNASDFTASGSCGASLAPAATCQVTVTFTASDAGTRTASLTATAQGATTQFVALQGTGVADFSLTGSGGGAGSSGLASTVTAGQPATYALALAPAGSFSGTITLSCTNLPAYAACSFNPPTLSAATASTVTLTITTQATVTASLRDQRPQRPASDKQKDSALALAGLAGVGLLAAARRRHSLQSRNGLLCSIALLSLCALLGVAGCAGGGSGGSSSSTPTTTTRIVTTPAGTYTVQVVATAGGSSHSVPVTLVVH